MQVARPATSAGTLHNANFCITHMVTSSTYAPFFEKQEVFPVVAVDETWLQAIQAAQAN